jgi:hypothetical protein
MPDDIQHHLALRQADQARTDFAAIEDDLDFIKSQPARLPTRKEQALKPIYMVGSAGLVIAWIELFRRYCL